MHNVTQSGPARAGEQPFARLLPWVLLVSLMFFLNYLDRAVFGPLLPAIEAEFSISHAASTSLLFYMSSGYSLSMFFSGFSSSKIRPRIMVGGSLMCTGLALQGVALAQSFAVVAVCLVCLGLAAGQYFNGGLSTLRSLVSPAQWGKAISIHEIGPNAVFFIAPLLAEFGLAYLGWRGFLSCLGWVTCGAGLLFLLIARGGDYPAAPVSFKGFTRALKEPKLWLFTWLMGLAFAGEFAPYSVLTLHMQDERALSAEATAFLLSASRIAAPFAVLGSGFIVSRFGVRRILRVCLAAYALGMFCMALPWHAPFLAGMFIQPLLTAMAIPPIFMLLAESFPMKDQPLMLAVGMPVSSFMGVGLMPSALGLFGDHMSFAAGFAAMGVLVALSLPLLRLMPAKQ